MEAWFYYTISPKKYIWHKKEKERVTKEKVNSNDDFVLAGEKRETAYTIGNRDYASKNNRSRLKSLANSLDMEIN
jgi:hypothetical protein